MSVIGVLPIAPQTPMIRPSSSQRPVTLQRFFNWILSIGVIAALLGAPSTPQASETVNAALPVQLAQAIQSPAVSTPTTSTTPASVSGAAPVAQAATSVFFLLMMAALIDVVAGFTIGIRVAKRDIGFGGADQ